MSEISAPPPPPPLPTGAAPPPPPPTAITLPPAQAQVPVPPAILQAALGATFDLQVANLGKQGLIDLDGAAGKLQLQLQALLNLKPGDTVTLQLNGRGPQLQFIITAINGQSPATLIRASATQSAQAGSQGTGGVLLNLPPFAEGNSLTATLLRPASGFAAPTPGTGGQPGALGGTGQSGPSLPGTNPAAGAPTAGQAPFATPQTPGTPAPGAPVLGTPPTTTSSAVPGSLPTGAAPTPQTLPVGTQFTVQLTAVQPPPPGGAAAVTQTQGPTPALATLGQTLTGIVTGTQAGGQPIVETALGPITLNGANPPPEGSRVVMTITGAPLPPAAPEPLLDSQQLTLRQSLFLDRHWPALDDAVEELAQHAPNMAQHLLQTAMPRTDANMTTNILFFLTAMRGGDVRSWLGDGPTRVLNRINPGLVDRLQGDIRQLSRLADEPATGDWRTLMIPMLNGQQLEQIRLFTRPQEEDDTEEGSGRGTRFVVDITLSNLGHIQLDGLIDTAHHRMDMVVRSDNHLPPGMRNDIRHLYEQSGDITGYRGGVGFQAQPANFIEVTPPAPVKGGVGLNV